MADRIEAKIICPYFRGLKKQRLICETGAQGAESMSLFFASNRMRNEYIGSFCASGCWRGCLSAQFNEAKYS